MSPLLKKRFLYFLPLAFLPYILICFYNNPNADDFVFGFLGKKDDLWDQWLIQYTTWSGRYTANFFVLAGPLKWGSFRLYKFIPLVMIVLHWFSVKYLIKNLVGKQLSKIELHLCTYLLVFLFIYNMPIISEGLYWYTGAVTYLLGCIVATLYITLVCRLYQDKWILKNKFVHLGILAILYLFCAGFNEVLMFMLVAFNITVFMMVQIFRLKHYGLTIALIFITILGSSLVLMAPGNAIRESQFANNHQFWHSMGFSLAQTVRFLAIWIFSPPLWILSFAWIFIHRKLVNEIPLFQKNFYLHRYISVLLLPLVIFISVFPAYWATGILGQHRTLNVAYYFFIFLWFMNLSIWYKYFEKRLSKIRPPDQKITISLFVICLGCFMLVKNGFYTTMDIASGRAAHFDAEMHQRYVLMRSDADTIVFTPIKNPPKTISFYEVTTDPHSWLNACWVSYFDKEGEAVVVKK